MKMKDLYSINNKKVKEIFPFGKGLIIKNLRKSYKKRPILRDVSFKLKKGEAIALLGPNGTGKTTAISLLAGEIVPNLGEWEEDGSWENVIDYYAGTDIQKHFVGLSDDKIKVALKPQYVDRIPKMFDGTLRELLENVASTEKVNEFAEKINITSLDKKVSKISGGELQKGAIAATLLKEADLYFFDEPSSYLDIEQRILMAKMISELG